MLWQWFSHATNSLRYGKQALQLMCRGLKTGWRLGWSLRRRCGGVCEVSSAFHSAVFHLLCSMSHSMTCYTTPLWLVAPTRTQWTFKNMAGKSTFHNTSTSIFPKEVDIYWHRIQNSHLAPRRHVHDGHLPHEGAEREWVKYDSWFVW